MTSSVKLTKKVTGERGYPFIGSLLEAKKDLLGFLFRTSQTHGPISFFKMGPMKIFLLTNPDYIRYILQDPKGIYVKSSFYQKLRYILGNGLVTSDGFFWKRQRKLAQPAFHQHYLAKLSSMMASETALIGERWQKAAQDKQKFDVTHDMMELTLKIIMQAMFGAHLKDDVNEIAHQMHVILEDVLHRSWAPVPIPLYIPTPNNRRIKKAKAFFDKIIYGIIDEHAQKKTPETNLLSMMMNAKDEVTGEGMTREQLRDEVMTIFMAGHETTATALSWTWYLLDQNPEASQKLRAELGTVLNGRAPTMEDLPKLPYTKMVLEESMRLYPPIWAISRMATVDDEIDGYKIPKGSLTMLGIYPMHRHPKYWDEPEKFIPERFSGGSNSVDKKYVYFPFGGGARICIGNSFAMMEGMIILALLAQKFNLHVDPTHPVVPQALLTLKSKNGIRVTATHI